MSQQFQFRITSMSTDLLNARTVFAVDVLEDLGVATRVRDRFTITLEEKFTILDENTQKAVDDYMTAHASALGLA